MAGLMGWLEPQLGGDSPWIGVRLAAIGFHSRIPAPVRWRRVKRIRHLWHPEGIPILSARREDRLILDLVPLTAHGQKVSMGYRRVLDSTRLQPIPGMPCPEPRTSVRLRSTSKCTTEIPCLMEFNKSATRPTHITDRPRHSRSRSMPLRLAARNRAHSGSLLWGPVGWQQRIGGEFSPVTAVDKT